MLVDAHVHLYEFDEKSLEEFKDIILVSVSEDLDSSRRVIRLSEEYSNVTPCVGLHPWNVDKRPMGEVDEILRIIEGGDVRCIGEVGLDLRFVPETIDRQREVFSRFLAMAREYDAVLNIHSPDAWREAFNMVVKADLDKAIFHWYTGPLDLLEEIASQGYYITVNAAVKIQEKSRRVVEKAPLSIILTESDGPYNYRGLVLKPTMVKDALSEVAKIKGVSQDDVEYTVYYNYTRLFK